MKEQIEKGLKLFKEKNFKEAIDCFQEVIEKGEVDFSIYNNIATSYVELENYDKAIEFYEKTLQKNIHSSEVYMNLSSVYHKINDLNSAINVLENGNAILPDDLSIRQMKADLLLEDLQYDNAMQELEFILDKNPNDIDANYDIAKIYFDTGFYESAINHYEKVLEEKEDSADIHYAVAQAYSANDDIDKAIFHLFSVISLNQAYYPAYKKLGIMLLAKGEKEEANEYFEKYIKFDLPKEEIEQIKKIINR